MKVMCINENFTTSPCAKDKPRPKFGDVDEVVSVESFLGQEYYELQRFEGSLFATHMFVPVSDIDETELVTEEFNEKYCVPVNQ